MQRRQARSSLGGGSWICQKSLTDIKVQCLKQDSILHSLYPAAQCLEFKGSAFVLLSLKVVRVFLEDKIKALLENLQNYGLLDQMQI